MNCLTKMTHYVSVCKTIDALTLAELFIQKVLWLHELSNFIVSNCKTVFISKFWSSFCFYLKVQQNLSTAFHPQIDEQTEHQNQTIKAYLRTYCNETQDKWAKLLSMKEFVYNNSQHTVTEMSPFLANSKQHLKLDFEVLRKVSEASAVTDLEQEI